MFSLVEITWTLMSSEFRHNMYSQNGRLAPPVAKHEKESKPMFVPLVWLAVQVCAFGFVLSWGVSDNAHGPGRTGRAGRTCGAGPLGHLSHLRRASGAHKLGERDGRAETRGMSGGRGRRTRPSYRNPNLSPIQPLNSSFRAGNQKT